MHEEHQRLFGYKPSKVYSSKSMKAKAKTKKRVSSWNKDDVCLRSKDQDVSPSIEEKIELAQLKLCKMVAFSAEGDAAEIHDIITYNFPVLSDCGGYTLM